MMSDDLNFSASLGKSAAVNEAVASAVAAWLPAWELPPAPAPGIKDLKGESIRVAKFVDEETCRFFFPRRKLLFQQRMTKVVTLGLRKRGARIVSVRLSVEDYARWQQQQTAADSPELRFRFATRPPSGVGDIGNQAEA